MHDYEASLEHDKAQIERVAFLLENLRGGGAERVILDLAEGFSALGYDVDLLVCEARGVLLDSIPSSINLVVLKPANQLTGLWAALGAPGGGLSAILSCVAAIRKIPRSMRFIPAIGDYLLEGVSECASVSLAKVEYCGGIWRRLGLAWAPGFSWAHTYLHVSSRSNRGLRPGGGRPIT